MKKKYLPLYKKWLKTGTIPGEGLCGSLKKGDKNLDLFTPTEQEFGARHIYWQAWAYDGNPTSGRDLTFLEILKDFTPMRQTVLLFLAAMNGEL